MGGKLNLSSTDRPTDQRRSREAASVARPREVLSLYHQPVTSSLGVRQLPTAIVGIMPVLCKGILDIFFFFSSALPLFLSFSFVKANRVEECSGGGVLPSFFVLL